MIKLPDINADILRVILKILDENYPSLRASLKMIGFMMFVSTHESDKERLRENYFALKKFMFRKVTENICHLMGEIP